MVSQENNDKFKNSVISLLLFRYHLSVKESISVSEAWLEKHQIESWETLNELLKNQKIVLKQGILFDLPQLSPAEAISVAKELQGKNGVEIKDRWFKLRLYSNCFIGSEMVSWLVQNKKITPEEAIAIGQSLLKQDLIHHVHNDHDFKNEFLFYRFKNK